MPTEPIDDYRTPLWGKVIALTAVAVAVAFAASAIVLLGAGKAYAGPHYRPSIDSFVPGTFACGSHVIPKTTTRVAEFSASYDGPWDMDVWLVEYIDGRAVNVTGDDIVSGVNQIEYDTPMVPLYGSTSVTDKVQEVVIRVEGIRADQEFGVYARWSPDGIDQPLERWFGYQKDKCGDPLRRYQIGR